MSRKPNLTGDEYNKVFPQRLREIMRSKNITQKDLAVEISKTRQAVSYYMDGSSGPDWETLAKIASFLGVSSDYLLGLSERKESTEKQLAYLKMSRLSDTSLWNLRELGAVRYDEAVNALLSSDKIVRLVDGLERCLTSYEFETEREELMKIKKAKNPDYAAPEKIFDAIVDNFLENGLSEEQARTFAAEESERMKDHEKLLIRVAKENEADLAIFQVQRAAVEIAEDLVKLSKSKFGRSPQKEGK